jgi:D-mannonate dehydratase
MHRIQGSTLNAAVVSSSSLRDSDSITMCTGSLTAQLDAAFDDVKCAVVKLTPCVLS